MDIRIETFPPERGRKVIIVDDVQWGYIHMRSHGGQGSSYVFEQIGDSGEITEPFDPPSKSGRMRTVTVDGDKWARRRANHGNTVQPLADRLMATARSLIERGKLQHPDTVAKRLATENEAWKAQRAKQERTETEALLARARDIVGQMQRGACGEHLENEIIAAMRWAQTQ